MVLISPEGDRLRYAIHLHFPASNNIAEYEGLINGICIAIELRATRLYAYGDSKLVVDQVPGGAQTGGQVLRNRVASCPAEGQQ
jgi:ribonuclease HI